MKTAKQANKAASGQYSGVLAGKMKAIEKKIEAAISRGEFSYTEVHLDQSVANELCRLGYTITQGQGDYRDAACYTITW